MYVNSTSARAEVSCSPCNQHSIEQFPWGKRFRNALMPVRAFSFAAVKKKFCRVNDRNEDKPLLEGSLVAPDCNGNAANELQHLEVGNTQE